MSLGAAAWCLVQVFFWLMLVVPTTYQLQRGALLALLLMVAGIVVLRGRWTVHRDILLLSLLTVAASLLFMARGALVGGPGALHVGTVYVLWPLLYLLFIGLLTERERITAFLKTIIVGAIAAGLMGLWLVAEMLGIQVPGISAFLESQGAAVGLYDGYIEYALFNISTLIYSLPFLIAILFVPKHHDLLENRWRILAGVALCLTAVAMLVSGRRMFWLLGLISPLLVAGLFVMTRMPLTQLIVRSAVVFGLVLAILFSALSAFDIRMDALATSFLSAFLFSGGEESASLRGAQFVDLMEGWIQQPVLGAGHGTTAPEIIRSVEHPWAYELTYVALLYQTGLLGMLIYGLAVGWTFVKAIKIARREPDFAAILVPLLAGMTGFLISNATNPYLSKFDYLWTIFLPVAVINAYLVGRRKRPLQVEASNAGGGSAVRGTCISGANR